MEPLRLKYFSTKLRPLLKPARYKGAYGGRGGGKSHFFATMAKAYAGGEGAYRQKCDEVAAAGYEGFSLERERVAS